MWGFVVDRMPMGQVFLRVLRLCLVSFYPCSISIRVIIWRMDEGPVTSQVPQIQ
jgi:hypothetical protein